MTILRVPGGSGTIVFSVMVSVVLPLRLLHWTSTLLPFVQVPHMARTRAAPAFTGSTARVPGSMLAFWNGLTPSEETSGASLRVPTRPPAGIECEATRAGRVLGEWRRASGRIPLCKFSLKFW